MESIPFRFLEKFVRKNLRDRIEHEWRKKPEKLHYRICHKAEEVFPDNLKHDRVEFSSDEMVYLLLGGKPRLVPFSEAESHLGCGDGVLIIEETGSKFIAETESSHGAPYETYSGA